jgi:hypothetical protein
MLSRLVIPLKPPLLVRRAKPRVELARYFVPEPGSNCPEGSFIDRKAVGRPKVLRNGLGAWCYELTDV